MAAPDDNRTRPEWSPRWSSKLLHAEWQKSIVQKLIDARKSRGWSQDDLAFKLQVSQSFIAKIERSQRRLDMGQFLEFCRVLDVGPASIIETSKPLEEKGKFNVNGVRIDDANAD